MHTTIKERQANNDIVELQNNQGEVLTTASDIQNEILSFYQKLQGSSTKGRIGINKAIMRAGTQLDSKDTNLLSRDINDKEIIKALYGINDSKAPSVDGFNAVFFKKAWYVMQNEFIAGVQEFFTTNKMFPWWIVPL